MSSKVAKRQLRDLLKQQDEVLATEAMTPDELRRRAEKQLQSRKRRRKSARTTLEQAQLAAKKHHKQQEADEAVGSKGKSKPTKVVTLKAQSINKQVLNLVLMSQGKK